MFNRLVRCLSIRNAPNIKPTRTIIPRNAKSLNRGLFLLQKSWFCTTVGKPLELSPENETKSEKDKLTLAIESDPVLEKRYKILQLEIDVLRNAGHRVPNDISTYHWLQLISKETRTARRKYLQFLFVVEKRDENSKKKKELARIEREKLRESASEESDMSEYRLNKVSMFMRIYDTTMNQFYHSRVIQAMMFGPKLIIDCGYYDNMTYRESHECAKQLAFMLAENRVQREPFDLYFCNVNKSSALMQKLSRIIPTIYEPTYPLNIVEESYTETFDRNKLVYLTPHCKNEMTKFDPDAIYIVGGIVDKTNSEPLSLGKAKKERLKMAKLPLDKYLLWGSGSSKRLPLNQIVKILTDIRVTGDWEQALKHVPRRKLEKSFDNSVTNERNGNNKPFRSTDDEIPRSFTFRDRQRRSFNK